MWGLPGTENSSGKQSEADDVDALKKENAELRQKLAERD